jgi:hypothetical protein
MSTPHITAPHIMLYKHKEWLGVRALLEFLLVVGWATSRQQHNLRVG